MSSLLAQAWIAVGSWQQQGNETPLQLSHSFGPGVGARLLSTAFSCRRQRGQFSKNEYHRSVCTVASFQRLDL